jgi:nitroreductase / dihydropteridine reductase
MSLVKDLQWRYATKNMNGKKVSPKKLEAILEAIHLAPSSFGLQPFTVSVINRQTTKDKLMAAAHGQKQIGSSSHILVFAVPLKLTAEDVQAFINNIVETRGMPAHLLDGYKGMMTGMVTGMSAEQQQNWATKQAYIAFGMALAAAAEQKVDACPMEGFDGAQFDKILGLDKKGLKSVVILPIGFRAEDDDFANYAKVRKPKEQMFIS